MPIIEIDNLTYVYPGAKTPSLDNVTIDISKGEFVAIIGANNSGKSTFCHALSGIVPRMFNGEFHGKVKINGADISAKGLHEIADYVGIVMQIPGNQLSGIRFSVFEEVAFGLENQGISRANIIKRVSQVLSMTGLDDLADRSPYQLSGGQQQRLSLAAALATSPPIIVLDEPTTFLDPKGTEAVFQILNSLREEDVTIIIAEQRLEWIAENADRIIVFKKGKPVMDGRPNDVLTSPILKEINLEYTRYTKVARLAQENGLWSPERPLSSTFLGTLEGLKILRASGSRRHGCSRRD